jgi:O-methyltransferase
MLLVHNVLWSGRVVDASATEADTVAPRAFNDKVAADDGTEVVVLTAFDGLTMFSRAVEPTASQSSRRQSRHTGSLNGGASVGCPWQAPTHES